MCVRFPGSSTTNPHPMRDHWMALHHLEGVTFNTSTNRLDSEFSRNTHYDIKAEKLLVTKVSFTQFDNRSSQHRNSLFSIPSYMNTDISLSSLTGLSIDASNFLKVLWSCKHSPFLPWQCCAQDIDIQSKTLQISRRIILDKTVNSQYYSY